MAKGFVKVEGLRPLLKDIERAGADVEDMKDGMAEIAEYFADYARKPSVLPRRSGALAKTARGNRAKGSARVTIGRAAVPYAGPIVYGWPSRNIRPAGSLEKMDREANSVGFDMLEEAVEKLLRKNDLI